MELSKQTTDRTYRHPDCSVRPASTDPLNNSAGDERGCTLILEPSAASEPGAHHDTAIPKPGAHHDTTVPKPGVHHDTTVPKPGAHHDTTIPKPVPGIREARGTENRKVHSASSGSQETFPPYGDSGSLDLRFSGGIPDRIRKMYSLYEYEGGVMQIRAWNFYRQALFMKDYEDDVPWKGNYTYYFPTYHSLTVSQLRGYFSWRTRIRRGEYCPIPTSIAYLYIYELLNGIGADSPEDRINKIKEFEAGFLDSGIGDPRMRKNLHRWIFELAVVHNLPPESVKQYLDPELTRRDEAISILLHPEMHTDEDVFSALCILGGDKLSKSPAALHPEKGRHLFREAWLAVSSHDFGDGTGFHTLCFGARKMRPWYPFANAIYYWPGKPKDREYVVDECRIYRCRNGSWLSECYEKLHFDKTLLQSFLRETDRMLRLYLKTGRYLKEKEADAWASPFISAVIDEDRRLTEEAARPKITIDLSDLDRIRRDALKTRDSLLTEEDLEELRALPVGEAREELKPLPAGEAWEELKPLPVGEAREELKPLPAGEAREELKPLRAGKAPEELKPLPAGEAREKAAALIPEDIRMKPEPCTQADIRTGLNPYSPEDIRTGLNPCSPEDIRTKPELPLDPVQIRILLRLLDGSSPADIIREHHLMPSLIADAINEAMYDEFGDTVISCDDDALSLVDDYREDLAQMLEGAYR